MVFAIQSLKLRYIHIYINIDLLTINIQQAAIWSKQETVRKMGETVIPLHQKLYALKMRESIKIQKQANGERLQIERRNFDEMEKKARRDFRAKMIKDQESEQDLLSFDDSSHLLMDEAEKWDEAEKCDDENVEEKMD